MKKSLPTTIAEVKTMSPFGYRSELGFDQLFDMADRYGDIISIHTDPRWGGDFKNIRLTKSRTKKPILAKGIHATDDDIRKAIDMGADYVLVVGRVPDIAGIDSSKLMIEPMSLAELKNLPPDIRAVWNSRDLETGGLKKETFAEARSVFTGWLCQASNIKSVGDIESGADAVLVGQGLQGFVAELQGL